MFFLFLILIIGPVIASKFIATPKLSIFALQQPDNWNNNDTLGTSQTGTALLAAAATSAGSKMRRTVMFTYDG